MSFSKAYRQLELSTNYNPPPNYYQHSSKMEIQDDQVHNTFAREERFKSQQNNKNKDFPGPGQYYKPSKSISKGYKMVAPKETQSLDQQFKINSIPSIPKQSASRAYEELAPGILVLHQAELQEGQIGPGSYDPILVTKKGVGYKFSSNFNDRFQKKQQPQQPPRPYFKRPQHPKINLKQKLKHPQKKAINSADLCLELIILRQKQLKVDEIPPPGYYYNQKMASGFIVDEKPKQFQLLAGKAKRFDNVKKQEGVGPGQYQLISINKFTEKGSIPRAQRNIAFVNQTRNNPGPGAYTSEPKQEQEVKNKVRHPPIFSSGCVRFASQEKQITPGPGQYNVQRSRRVKQSKAIRVSVENKTAKEFRVNQKIDPYLDLSKTGFYQGRISTTNSRGKNQSSAFASKIKRFKEAESSMVGPGIYDIESKIRTKFNRKDDILQKQQRFKYSSTPNEIGPGYYFSNDDSIRPKKTHDIIFK